MPILKNPQHERFAQELAKGTKPTKAFVSAGFARNTGNAARLKANESVRKRVAELQAEMAEVTIISAAMTRAEVLAELSALGRAPIDPKDIRPRDKLAALTSLARLEGWSVDRHADARLGDF